MTENALRKMLFYLNPCRFFRQLFCRHRFDFCDLWRLSDDKVVWRCWKCDKIFFAGCGLDILRHGEVQSEKHL